MRSAWSLNPFGLATAIAARMGMISMGLLQPPPTNNNHRFDEQSERDLLITLAVQMDNLRRTVTALVWAVGLVVVGVVPFSLVLAFYGIAIYLLWRGIVP